MCIRDRYYTGHKIIKINGDESRWDDRDKIKKRSAEWSKKYLMEQVNEEEFNKIIASGKPLMLIVPKGEIKHFRQSTIYPNVSESSEAGTAEVYILCLLYTSRTSLLSDSCVYA